VESCDESCVGGCDVCDESSGCDVCDESSGVGGTDVANESSGVGGTKVCNESSGVGGTKVCNESSGVGGTNVCEESSAALPAVCTGVMNSLVCGVGSTGVSCESVAAAFGVGVARIMVVVLVGVDSTAALLTGA